MNISAFLATYMFNSVVHNKSLSYIHFTYQSPSDRLHISSVKTVHEREGTKQFADQLIRNMAQKDIKVAHPAGVQRSGGP